MTPPATLYQLNIQQFGQTCVFILAWGQGQQLQATLDLPPDLIATYKQWQQTYLEYYRRVHLPLTPAPGSDNALRGKAAGSGTVAPPIDWGKQLRDAEQRLLTQFHDWLRGSEQLDDLRREIAGAGRRAAASNVSVDVLITCNPIDLARLPWETWDIAKDFAIASKIRIGRSASNIRQPAAIRSQRRPRILMILGDDRGLDFRAEVEALQRLLRPLADLRDVRWQPGQCIDELKDTISRTIADPKGWDVLLFAGHSNETAGGELGIAPNVSIQIRDIEPQLLRAKELGLQFALFNSCKGINLATSLINLGLNQVVILREPIENRVAQEFLVRFLQSLARHEDVHEAMIAASQHLATDKKLTYPSAYLVPSLFRHPGTTLYRIPPRGWRYWLRPWLSKRYEWAALAFLTVCSLLTPIQLGLLSQRVLLQAHYRQLTQRDAMPQPAPVLLVRIDEESLRRANLIGKEHPIPQAYLADLINRLVQQGAKGIAVDYVLDSEQPDGTPKLAQAVQQANQQGVQLIFGANLDNDGNWYATHPQIVQSAQIQAGDVVRFWRFNPYHLPLLDPKNPSPFPLFAELIAQLHYRQHHAGADLPTAHRQTYQPLSRWAWNQFAQVWLHPITDFSLRPSQVYQAVPAWQVLSATALPNLPQQTVMIASGGYASAGFKQGDDNFTAPAAISYWYRQDGGSFDRLMTGGEHQAYLVNHFLHQRFVLPIPDLWMLLLAALLGKSVSLRLQQSFSISSRQNSSKRSIQIVLVGSTLLYGLLSLELYLSSAAILLPILLPVAIFWIYVFPTTLKPQ